ncbi:MAG: glycoside hydrolase family 31 protein [Thermoleophilia bacterium]|nr:glycoside hydrolase family 31 protein [Thermoleophilia bacterium]
MTFRESPKLLLLAALTGLMLFGATAATAQATKSQGSKHAGEAVRSGNLTATATGKPWAFELTDQRGRKVLAEQPGRGTTSAGTIGFRVGGDWKHAIRVRKSWRQGSSRLMRVATTDPQRDLKISVEPADRGSIRLRARIVGPLTDVAALGMAFHARKGERYLGFGERSNSVDQRGKVVENWVGEGPYQPDEYPVIRNSVPEWALRTTDESEDATYFPMPWLLSTAGYGVLVENSEPSYFRLGTDQADTWSLELSRDVDGLARQPVDAPSPRSISIRFFAGPKPAGALRRMSAAIGRQPAPAPWFLGPWVQSKDGDQETIDRLRTADVPTSVGQTYAHYLPCGDQRGDEQGQRDRTDLFHRSGMAVTTYFNPMICTNYDPPFDELAANGEITRDRTGLPYEYKYLRFTVGQFDFSSPGAQDSYGNLLREALDDGYDGWMEDFGEYTPPDSVSADGTPGMVMHNQYPRDYHCSAHEQTKDYGRPVLRFIRSGYTGAAACAPVVWGGDPSTTWDYDGLRAAVTNGITMGLSGVGVWGSDIGGYFSLLTDPLSPELLTRWVQFGAFSGAMRSQANGFQLGYARRPQILDLDQIDNWRRYAKLRTQLFPYLRAAAVEYRRNGLPMMRAMALQFPYEPRAVAQDDQYMFGPGLMVAPVTEPGATTRRVYLPKGRWVDLWRTIDYDAADGSFDLDEAKVLGGGRWKTMPAPLDEIPLLARAGALLTTLDPDVDTLTDYGSDNQEIVNLDDRSGRRLLAFPRGRSVGYFNGRGRLYSKEGKRSWRLKVVDGRTRTWKVDASLSTMRQSIKPRCVKLDGRKMPADSWTYRNLGQRFETTFSPKKRIATLEVSAGRC